MAKGKKTKKKNLRLRRQLRKTFGCLFMVSALIVTAIPVQPIAAAGGWSPTDPTKCWVKSSGNAIPTIQKDKVKVYQDETENFRFVYVDSAGVGIGGDKNKSAIIVDYNQDQDLPGGNLTIPATVDAYVKYTDSGSATGSYAAANKKGYPLYYKSMKTVTRQVEGDMVLTSEDLNGNGKFDDYVRDIQTRETEEFDRFLPCIATQANIWSPDGIDVPLYYYDANDGIPTPEALGDDADSNWALAGSKGDDDNRIDGATVRYIGKQYADYNETTGNWEIIGDCTSQHSVFGGTDEGQAAANIANLTFGTIKVNGQDSSPLVGIGDYAFYGCTNIRSIKLGNGLNTLGNYAFADCRNLVSADLNLYSNLDTLGAYAFANCESLDSISIPTNIAKIGDFCFKECFSLKSVDMAGTNNGLGYNLKEIGYKAFEKCESLESLTFPQSYDGAQQDGGNVFHLSTVEGCRNLKFIKTYSQRLDFVTNGTDGGTGTVDGDYTFERFKGDVGSKFYFEGPGYVGNGSNKTPSHKTANVQHICFKYLDEKRYEIVEEGEDESGTKVGLVYQVNESGDLIKFQVEDVDGKPLQNVKVPEIIMPDEVGPYGIYSLVEGSFNNNCAIRKVVVPKSVTSIGSNAFKGSHNLEHIIFNDATKIESIGTDAFATQVVDRLHGNAMSMPNTCTDTSFLTKTPFMSFTGAIEKEDGKNTEPFKYAMKDTSKVNAGQQPLSYITYYSGMPTNLTVKYNPETAKSELTYFPTKEDLRNGFKAPDGYVGAYESGGVSYRFPYMDADMAQEAIGGADNPTTENQQNMRNGVENIVIPAGVQSIKEGLFSGLTVSGNTVGTPSTWPDETYTAPAKDVKTITTKSIDVIEPYTFARLPELVTAYISGALEIGNYAFDQCLNLEAAEVGAETGTLGLRPFSGCEKLVDVNFKDSPYFKTEDGVIYGLEGGTKTKIIECLEGRGSIVGSRVVGPDELAGIKEIAPEAFMDCDFIRQVDLSSSVVTEIPERTFAECDRLNSVELPNTIRAIRNGAFWNMPELGSVKIPDSISVIAPNAFAIVPKNPDGTYGEPEKDRGPGQGFDFITLPGSVADIYAKDYPYIDVKADDSLKKVHEVVLIDGLTKERYKTFQVRDGENLELTILDINEHEGYRFTTWWPSAEIYNPIVAPTEIMAMYEPVAANTYTVRFFDINREEMTEYTQQVEEGKSAIAPPRDVMAVEGKVFIGWDREYSEIKGNVDIYAQYSDRAEGKYYVTFYTDSDMATMIGKVQEVDEGESAIEPAHPTKEGFTFSGWSSDGWKNVTRDWDIFALYTQGGDSNKPDDPNNPDDPNKPGNSGDNNNGGNNGGDSSSDGDKDKDKDKDSVSENATKYKVVVNGGSGSGDYTAGTIVPINAYARADGTVFDKWTSSSNGVGFVNQTAISTTFTMPANNVEINANFKADTSSVSGNSRSARRNSTTTVDVTKNGISNTGLASANVNGTSDNYVVRVTDDAQATAAVIAALEARYGDLSNIAYLPMDISLYDSTGQTKITDVSGISVDITLPLPDGLIQYAGNNRAASVADGRLEDLGTKFTTIDGVPCVQFTATHFSPYAIYVDKGNLTEGLIDATPKTGDPIHPKWFLAMGLACISIILFCKKDKKQPKVKAA